MFRKNLKSALVPAVVAAAAAMAPGAASADAVAQAILDVSSFSIQGSQGGYSVIYATDSGDVSASIYGAPAVTDTFNGLGTFTLQESVGPNAGSYSPMTALAGSPTLNYVGSYSYLNGGDPQNGDVVAQVDNTVSLTPGGVGTAQSNVNLNATFQILVGNDGTAFTLDFDATSYLRTMLNPFGAVGSANAAFQWIITVQNSAGATVFNWEPDGTVNSNITGGTESYDDFDLSQSSNVNLGGFDFPATKSNSGSFTAVTSGFAAGLYVLTIDHKSNADATLRIPEPGVLSLLALGMFGFGAVARIRKMRE